MLAPSQGLGYEVEFILHHLWDVLTRVSTYPPLLPNS